MYHIEKNTVQETLIIPLYGRKVCSEHFPDLFKDPEAKKFPGAVIAFDSCNRRGAKIMIKFCDSLVKMQIIKITFR